MARSCSHQTSTLAITNRSPSEQRAWKPTRTVQKITKIALHLMKKRRTSAHSLTKFDNSSLVRYFRADAPTLADTPAITDVKEAI